MSRSRTPSRMRVASLGDPGVKLDDRENSSSSLFALFLFGAIVFFAGVAVSHDLVAGGR